MKDNATGNELLLDVRGLKKYFPIQSGLFRRTTGYVRAVDGVSLQVRQGETLGLVGESGCGKTTAGRTILQLLPPTDGEVLFNDPVLGWVHLEKLNRRELTQVRPNMQIIFQDPFASLDSRMTVKRIVGEPLMINRIARGQELEDRVAHLLRIVGLRPEYMSRYPHAFSGGQRQRLGIARALALDPKLVICDEPVSALDVSIQAQVINLLEDLQASLGLAYVFIAHDLSVVEHIADRVAVMYLGKLVEMAATDDLYGSPKHPYTEALLASVPKLDPLRRERPVRLEGEVGSSANPPSGCYFHPRCRYAVAECSQAEPPLQEVIPGHWVACHRSRELQLIGVLD